MHFSLKNYSHSEPVYQGTSDNKRVRTGTRHVNGYGQQIGELQLYRRPIPA